MNGLQQFWVEFATLLQPLTGESYSLALRFNCDVPKDEDAKLAGLHGKSVKRSGKFISSRCKWDGRIDCRVRLADLNLQQNQVRTLTEFLSPGCPPISALAEAIVESHRKDFAHFVGTFEDAAWKRACRDQHPWEYLLESSSQAEVHMVVSANAKFVTGLLQSAPAKEHECTRTLQIDRYAGLLLRVAHGGYHVEIKRADCGQRPWNGDIVVTIREAALGVNLSHLRSIRPLLAGVYCDWLGDAVLSAQLDDFEKFVADVAPAEWSYASRAFRHRAWGLTICPDSKGVHYELAFRGHISRVAEALNVRLLQAAMEGAGE